MNALTQDSQCAERRPSLAGKAGMMEVRMPILLTAPNAACVGCREAEVWGAKAGTLPKQRRDDLDSFPTKVIFLLLS